MTKTSAEAIREELGLTGIAILGYNDKDESIVTLMDGENPIGAMAIELVAVFFESVIRNHDDVDREMLATLGAMICTEGLKQALERMEKENVKAE